MCSKHYQTVIRHALWFVLFGISGQIHAATLLGAGDAGLMQLETATLVPQMIDEPNKVNWKNGTYGIASTSPQSDSEVQPFGAELFSGGFRGMRTDDLNPDYKVVPGDQVTLKIWGAIDVDRVMPVDSQGNIFIPAVGPVKVQGISSKQLDAKVRAAVNTVYQDNISVYTNLQGVQPVAVFVTGFVNKPGRYAGTPNDSVLYFLDQSGGIDEALGSYREIRVLRNGKEIAKMDLYAFLLEGILDRPQFQDGDTVVVERRGPIVTVVGEVERAYRYELTPSTMKGDSILSLARTKPDVTHALLRGTRQSGPISSYHPMIELADLTLSDGDELLFTADQVLETIVVQIEGRYLGQSRYTVPNNTLLNELLDNIEVPAELADVSSVSIRRLSVAERQKASLMDSLARLQSTYLGASSATAEEAEIRVKEAELISVFVEKASKVQPNGRLVVVQNDHIANVRLQDGDIITIPEKSDSLLISGEVLVPQAVVFSPNRTAKDYITGAGGFTEHANVDQVMVIRTNGEVRIADNVTLKAGDEILVLPVVPTKNLQLASTLTQILYHIAIASRVVLDI
jgi:protein involved in polysaccharide export with SLBB domain